MERIGGWLALAGARGWQLGGVAVAIYVLGVAFDRLVLLVLLLFVAAVVATLLAPVARWLEQRGLPASAAATLAVAGATLLAVAALGLVVGQVATTVASFSDELQQVTDDVRTWLIDGPLGLSADQVEQARTSAIEVLRGSGRQVAGQTLAALSGLGALLAALVLAFFLVRDGASIRAWVLRRLVAEHQREMVATAGVAALDAFRGYVRAVVVIGALDALLIGAGLFLLGVPLALGLATLTFVGGLFPVVGATVVGALAVLVAGATGGLVDAVLVGTLVLVVQQVDGNVLQPVIMGREVHLHPAVVLVVLTLGALLGGLPGALLAIPITAVVVAGLGSVREQREQDGLLAPRAEDLAPPQT